MDLAAARRGDSLNGERVDWPVGLGRNAPTAREWFTAPELLEAQVTTKRVSETGGRRGGAWQVSLLLIQM